MYLHCSETVPVQCKREGKGTLFYQIKSDPVQYKRSLSIHAQYTMPVRDTIISYTEKVLRKHAPRSEGSMDEPAMKPGREKR